MFTIPFPHLSIKQGNNIGFILSLKDFWIIGGLLFVGRLIQGLYLMNQPPIIQKINLPEAQGKISSWNQVFESLGYGSAPIIGGILLSIFDMNFQTTVIIIVIIGLVGALCWLMTLPWLKKDISRISKILENRALEMKKKI